MKIETINPHVIKILISLRKEDSISSISKRINLSYGWTNKWVNELIKEGILKKKWRGVVLNEENKSYKKIISFVKDNLKDINFYYSVLELFGVKYCFTKTDAVFIWTKGGYNIARYKGYYPIFIKIKKDHFKVLKECCKKLNLKIGSKKGVFYSIEVLDEFEISYSDSIPVDSLEEAVKFMRENIYNFQPALEMIQEMYNKNLDIKYREINYV